jgi:predicted RNase H-related nuclease YkuK (DUF458 family)
MIDRKASDPNARTTFVCKIEREKGITYKEDDEDIGFLEGCDSLNIMAESIKFVTVIFQCIMAGSGGWGIMSS